MQQTSEAHGGAHHGHEPHIPGVTHDAVLRPVGVLFVVIGCLWALFTGMSIQAGTPAVWKGAIALLVIGGGLAALGKRQQQI
jgi:hypothetical protein